METTNFSGSSNEKIKATDLSSLWGRVMNITQSQAGHERFARLIAAVSAIGAALLMLEVVRSLLSSTSNPNDAIASVSAGALMLVYFLNRRGYTGGAALGLIGVFILAPVVVILIGGQNPTLLALALLVSAAGIPLTAALFPGWKWRWLAALMVFILYALLPVIHPVYAFSDVVYLLIGLAIFGAAGMAVENLHAAQEVERRGELQQANTALQAAQASQVALQKENSKLKQELQDSGIELQATVDEFLLAKEATERAKGEAERANMVKSAFLASMSHELRTPLNAVINFTKFVAKGSMGPVNKEQSDTLYEVIDSAKHLLSLINDVLDMSKIESGSLSLFIEENIDLKSIVETAMTTGKVLLGDKSVLLEATIAPDLPAIKGDRQRILQILLNIVSNACKFTEEGSIKVQAYSKENEVIFVVADSGPGIAPEDQSAVFEAFKQTTTGLRQGGGTGLGMPISKNLAEAHGGRLWLESQVGKGTTFYVALPFQSEKLVTTPVK